MDENGTAPSGEKSKEIGGVPRRTVVKGAAWSIPVIATAVALPSASASGPLRADLVVPGAGGCVSPGEPLGDPAATVTVTGGTGAVSGATVMLVFSSADGGTVVHAGQSYPGTSSTIQATTDGAGVARFAGFTAGAAGTVTVVAKVQTGDGRTVDSNVGTFVVCAAGTLYAWGRDGEGQIVQGVNGGDSNVPLTWKNQDKSVYTGTALQLAGAWSSFTFLRPDGSVWSAGDGAEGQLGNGGSPRPIQPYPMPATFADGSPVTGITRIFGVGGLDCTMIAFGDGVTYGTGENHSAYDMFAVGTSTDYYYSYVPIGTKLPGGGADIKDVAISGYYLNFFLKKDGTVYAAGTNNFLKGGWGSTNAGEFSSATAGFKTVQTSDGAPLVATAIGANERHAVFLGADGVLYGSGANESGALPGLTLGTRYRWATPLQALPSGTPTRIWTGYNRTFVKSSDGTVYAAGGGNRSEALGTGSTSASNNAWTAVSIDDEIIDISSSHYFWTGFLTAGGKVYFAGVGDQGQPGSGASGTHATPVEVPAPAGKTRATLIATTHEGAFAAAWV